MPFLRLGSCWRIKQIKQFICSPCAHQADFHWPYVHALGTHVLSYSRRGFDGRREPLDVRPAAGVQPGAELLDCGAVIVKGLCRFSLVLLCLFALKNAVKSPPSEQVEAADLARPAWDELRATLHC